MDAVFTPIVFVLAGLMGASIKLILDSSIQDAALIIPRIEKLEKKKLIRLGFLGSVIIGIAVSLLVNHDFITAMIASAGVSFVDKIKR